MVDSDGMLHAASGADIYILGGRTRPTLPFEAEAGAAHLRATRIPSDRLHCEDRSRHTLENLRAYRAAFPPADAPALVTSRFHLARASLMANGLGLAHRPCAAEADRTHLAALPATLLFEAWPPYSPLDRQCPHDRPHLPIPRRTGSGPRHLAARILPARRRSNDSAWKTSLNANTGSRARRSPARFPARMVISPSRMRNVLRGAMNMDRSTGVLIR